MGALRRAKLDVRGVSLDLYTERTRKSLPVLCDLDLAVFDGELVSIVGPSGCGKSTFLNAVDGLIRVTTGEILVDGRAVNGPGADRAMVFQHDSLFPWRTVRDNVMYGLAGSARWPWSSWSASPVLPITTRTSFPAECASESTSRALW
jgi:NitT/TauT family transport system ATP-binding protein